MDHFWTAMLRHRTTFPLQPEPYFGGYWHLKRLNLSLETRQLMFSRKEYSGLLLPSHLAHKWRVEDTCVSEKGSSTSHGPEALSASAPVWIGKEPCSLGWGVLGVTAFFSQRLDFMHLSPLTPELVNEFLFVLRVKVILIPSVYETQTMNLVVGWVLRFAVTNHHSNPGLPILLFF